VTNAMTTDTPTPRWLKASVWLAVGFAGGYLFLATLAGDDFSARGSYAREIDREAAAVVGQIDQLRPDSASLERIRGDQHLLAYGKGLYLANCASCHANDAGGTSSGPSLVDEKRLHIGADIDVIDVIDVIDRGVAERGMPAFHGRLGYNDVIIVSGYVTALDPAFAAPPDEAD